VKVAPGTKEEKKVRWSSDLVLDFYSKLLMDIWEIVSALIGEAIVELLYKLAIRKLVEKHPFLSSVKVSEEGVSLEGIGQGGPHLTPTEIHRGFHSLITHLFDLFSALAEGVVSRELFPKVFPKVKEAERMIAQK